jgi:hypothetical protein
VLEHTGRAQTGCEPQAPCHGTASHSAGIRAKAVLSVPDGVAKAMVEHDLSPAEATGEQWVLPMAGACPDCGWELGHESGCVLRYVGGGVPRGAREARANVPL